MTATAHPPSARLLPVWLGVSLAIHAVALLGADALIAALPQPSPPLQKTRVMFAGRVVTPPPPQPEQVTPQAPAVATPAPQQSSTRYSRPARRAGLDARTSATGAIPRPQTPPSQAVGGSADRAPGTAQQRSASAPEPGRPGAAYADPLAGGGSQLLTRDGGGPVGFQVATASGGGGSSGGGVGGGVPGGTGVSSGGGGITFAGGDARGTGPGGGTSAGEGACATRPAPQVRPAPTPDPPPPATKPDPPPPPKPSQADLSRFRSMVQARITGARRYPSSARDAGQQGTVRVGFRVSPGGQPSGISVASSSGYQSLDTAARRAVSAAGPYRPFPKGMSSSIRVTATVVFRLN